MVVDRNGRVSASAGQVCAPARGEDGELVSESDTQPASSSVLGGAKMPESVKASCLRMPANITWKDLPTGMVLLDLTDAAYFTLNDTAAHVWHALASGQSREQAVEALIAEFDCEQTTAEADVAELLQEFLAEHLLEVVAP